MGQRKSRQKSPDPSDPSHEDSFSLEEKWDALGSLLKDKGYLGMFVRYFDKNDLIQYSLVCQLWKSVCRESIETITQCNRDRLAKAASLYPNLRHIHLKTQLREVNAEVYKGIGSITRLEHLTWEVVRLNQRRSGYNRVIRSSTGFGLLHRLLSIDLRIAYFDEVAEYCSGLRALTALTSLSMDTSTTAEPPTIAPFVELRHIQRLVLWGHWILNREGELMFPSLTNLTHLSFSNVVLISKERTVSVLEAILPYASSICSLCSMCRMQLDDSGRQLLPRFTRLHTLALHSRKYWNHNVDDLIDNEMYNQYAADELESVFRGLLGMDGIQELDLLCKDRIDLTRFIVTDFLLHLINLKRLRAIDVNFQKEHSPSPQPYFVPLANLTRLEIEGRNMGQVICELTQLVYLDLRVRCTSEKNLGEIVCHMNRLEHLAIEGYQTWHLLNSKALSCMSKLKSLEFIDIDLEDDFFANLSSNKRLTRFVLIQNFSQTIYPDFFLQRIGLIGGLEFLALELQQMWDPLKYMPEWRFENLRQFKLAGSVADCTQTRTLCSEWKKRFPLAQMMISSTVERHRWI